MKRGFAMQELKSYNNTYHAYCIEKLELQRLEDQKEQIRSKYFKSNISTPKVTTVNIYNSKTQTTKKKEILEDENFYIRGFGNYEDNYAAYMDELENNNILQNIEIQKNKVQRLKYYLNKMEYHLSQLKGIEYELFYSIIYDNLNISQAVEQVAEKHLLSARNIYKSYYPNIKSIISEYIKIYEKGH